MAATVPAGGLPRSAGLYDEVLRRLEYASPDKVAELLLAAPPGVQPRAVRALDLAVGNGLSADPLLAVGVLVLVGIDLIPEARDAALRDRPGAYAEYVVGDVGEPGLVASLVQEHGWPAPGAVGTYRSRPSTPAGARSHPARGSWPRPPRTWATPRVEPTCPTWRERCATGGSKSCTASASYTAGR